MVIHWYLLRPIRQVGNSRSRWYLGVGRANKANKDPNLSVSHALTSPVADGGSCDRFRDLFLYFVPATVAQAPVLTVLRICFYLNPTSGIFECCAAGFCQALYFRGTAIICNNRVFATAVNSFRSSFWSGIMLSVGGCYIALGTGGGENYSYIWAPSMVQSRPR